MSILRSVALGLCLLAVWPAARGAEPPTSSRDIRSLRFNTGDGGLAVQIQTSVPVRTFRCIENSESPREVVLEVPDFASHLESTYDLDGSLVRKAWVEQGNGSVLVRLRFQLGEGHLSGVEQTPAGLIIRFARRAVAGNPISNKDDYRVGVGDKLEINVFGHEDLNRIVDVRTDGTIAYPLIGDLHVAGKTVAEVDADITRVLGKDYLVDPQVGVDVKESQSRWVMILGEVRNPGKYLLKRNMRVIDLMAEAGGVTKDAGDRVSITHHDSEDADPRQIVVERDRLFAPDNQEANFALAPGDIVTVVDKEVFYIRGEVAKPGPYFLEKGMTVLKAITFAGGFSQFANRKDVVLLRTEDNRVQKKVTVNLKAIEAGKAPDVALKPNDLIIVPRRVF